VMLVAFEGIDGAGKTTQSRRLFAKLTELGMRVIYTKEPTEGEIGKILKRALKGEIELDQRTIALLFAADRIEHMRSLNVDGIVILDRYLLSSLAYQGAFLPIQWINELNRWVRLPDIVFYLDISPDIAINRIKNKEMYHSLNLLSIVRENYLKLIQAEPWKSITYLIDAGRKEEEISEEILSILLTRLGERG
jgi:dTMP kinase